MLGILAGCQTLRTLPDWQGEAQEVTATDPLPDCDWPQLTKVEQDGEEFFYTDTTGLGQLLSCREIANANHDVAAGNAEALRELKQALNEVLEEGDDQHELAEFQLNELERDRRDANLEAWAYKGLLALVLIATAL